MIPVVRQQPPADFDRKVRQPGLKWLSTKLPATHALDQPIPTGLKVKPFWTECFPEFYAAYKGICAYLGTYVSRASGAASIDHFAPKSKFPAQIYEWSNYRLACLAMNAQKNRFDDVLDPFELPPNVFQIVLETGQIFVNPDLADLPLVERAEKTIVRLKLDSAVNREDRATLFFEYKQGDRSAALMQRYHPFVWSEIVRQEQQ